MNEIFKALEELATLRVFIRRLRKVLGGTTASLDEIIEIVEELRVEGVP